LSIPTGLSIPVTFDPIALQAQICALVNLGARFDGVVAASDMAAITVMRELASCGIVVPRDVLVVGYDDIPAAELVTPSLTTIRQSLAAAGAGLVDGLLDQLAGNQPANVTVPCELIRRSSSQGSK